MTTPVLFLDDASRHAGPASSAEAQRTAMTLLGTLKRLRKINRRFSLNTAGPLGQCLVAEGCTLQATLGGVRFREEWDFIRILKDRSPLSAGLEADLLQAIHGLEVRTRAARVQSPALAWAILLESATVSFDAHPDWATAWVETTCTTLDDDGEIGDADQPVRNASQAAHADVHFDWLTHLGLSETPTAAQLWNEKADRFRCLRFLPKTEKEIAALEGSGAPFARAIAALDSLAADAAAWKDGEAQPKYSTKATPESEQRKNLCRFFDDATGKEELFDWHTRFTGSFPGRVHFRLDGTSRTIVVGYVGRKL